MPARTKDTAPEHSKLSPSHAYQWTACTASVPFAKANKARLPKDTSTPASREGTNAHTVAEKLVLGLRVPDYATPEMIRFGNLYRKIVLGTTVDAIEWDVETRVPLYYLKKERGTLDFYSFHASKGLDIVDYKFGRGPVESKFNKQMASYGRSIFEEFEWAWTFDRKTPFRARIFQPRVTLEPEIWESTWGELKDFTESEITPQAKLILAEPDWPVYEVSYSVPGASGAHVTKGYDKPTPPAGSNTKFAPSEATCKFCPAYAICTARHEQLMDEYTEIAKHLCGEALPTIAALTDVRMAQIVNGRKAIISWLDQLEDYLDKRMFAGERIPGRKIVRSKGAHRQWSDEVAAGNLLLEMKVAYDEIYETSMVSPARAEKLIVNHTGAKVVELFKLMRKPLGGPITVPESDPREEFTADVDDALKELLGGEEDFL